MFGFLNLFVAAGVALSGGTLPSISQALEEPSPAAFQFNDSGISWNDYAMDLEGIASLRKTLAVSFGSCSFNEPIEGLTTLGLL